MSLESIVALSVLHTDMHLRPVYKCFSKCQEWNYWIIRDTLIPNDFWKRFHQFTWLHPKMLNYIFTNIGINGLL